MCQLIDISNKSNHGQQIVCPFSADVAIDGKHLCVNIEFIRIYNVSGSLSYPFLMHNVTFVLSVGK